MTPIELGAGELLHRISKHVASWPRQVRSGDKPGRRWRARSRRVMRRELEAMALYIGQIAITREEASSGAEAGIRSGIQIGFRDAWLAAHAQHAAGMVEAAARYAAADDLAAQFIAATSKGDAGEAVPAVAQRVTGLCTSLTEEVSEIISRAIDEHAWSTLQRVGEPPPNPFTPKQSDG